MNRYVFIFFLYSACYAISVSQLEQLQKARKDIAVALNQYNAIAQMNIKEINAWKKKIQGYFSIIKKFDPEDAKRLKETMIDPTFDAIDKIIEQTKLSSKNSSLKKDTSKNVAEKKVNQNITQFQSTDDVALVELKKINAIKNEIEQMIELYRQSDDWYNVFEDYLKKLDPKDADAYRARVPLRKTPDESSKKIVTVPPGQTKKVTSTNAPDIKTIDEPKTEKVISEVMQKPVAPEVITPTDSSQKQVADEKKGSQQKPDESSKKIVTMPLGQAKKVTSTNTPAVKTIDEPKTEKVISEVMQKPVAPEVIIPTDPSHKQVADEKKGSQQKPDESSKKIVTVPLGQTKKQELTDAPDIKTIDEPKSKKVNSEVMEKDLDPVIEEPKVIKSAQDAEPQTEKVPTIVMESAPIITPREEEEEAPVFSTQSSLAVTVSQQQREQKKNQERKNISAQLVPLEEAVDQTAKNLKILEIRINLGFKDLGNDFKVWNESIDQYLNALKALESLDENLYEEKIEKIKKIELLFSGKLTDQVLTTIELLKRLIDPLIALLESNEGKKKSKLLFMSNNTEFNKSSYEYFFGPKDEDLWKNLNTRTSLEWFKENKQQSIQFYWKEGIERYFDLLFQYYNQKRILSDDIAFSLKGKMVDLQETIERYKTLLSNAHNGMITVQKSLPADDIKAQTALLEQNENEINNYSNHLTLLDDAFKNITVHFLNILWPEDKQQTFI